MNTLKEKEKNDIHYLCSLFAEFIKTKVLQIFPLEFLDQIVLALALSNYFYSWKKIGNTQIH